MPTTDDYRAVSQQHYHVECNIAAECHKKKIIIIIIGTAISFATGRSRVGVGGRL